METYSEILIKRDTSKNKYVTFIQKLHKNIKQKFKNCLQFNSYKIFSSFLLKFIHIIPNKT